MEQRAIIWRCPYHGNLRHSGWNLDERTMRGIEGLPIEAFAVVGKHDKQACIVSVNGLSREEVKAYAEMLLIGGCTWSKG